MASGSKLAQARQPLTGLRLLPILSCEVTASGRDPGEDAKLLCVPQGYLLLSQPERVRNCLGACWAVMSQCGTVVGLQFGQAATCRSWCLSHACTCASIALEHSSAYVSHQCCIREREITIHITTFC